MRSLTSAVVIIALSASVWGVGIAKPSASSLQEFTGRLEFSGEFNLFPYSASSPRGKECVSGVLPLRKHVRAKQLYNGKFVRISGRKVLYSSLVDQVGTERGWKGSQIPNYCGGEYVILAKKVRLEIPRQ